MFSWHKQYLTRFLRSLVRYCSWHSHKKFTSSRHSVISSISLPFRRPKISMIQYYMTGSCIQQHFLFYIRTFNAMAIGPLSLLWRRIWHVKYGTSRVLWQRARCVFASTVAYVSRIGAYEIVLLLEGYAKYYNHRRTRVANERPCIDSKTQATQQSKWKDLFPTRFPWGF